MRLHCAYALLPTGWARDVELEIEPGTDTFSRVVERAPASREKVSVPGLVVPGMANLHSHAFQRAMAGFAEARTHPDDSFWTWRELMYRFAGRIGPEAMGDIAAYLYVEMLKSGYTGVAEFHYIHRDAAGAHYSDRAELSNRVIAAALSAGIAITHLPVHYAYGGFGNKPPTEGQKRFILDADEYNVLLDNLHGRYASQRDVRIGIAFHSLRAVSPTLMGSTLAALQRRDPTAPIHIHIAEQLKEVEDCLEWSGQRPVAWLLDHAAVDERWCLVHATHLDQHEIEALAATGAVAGLCPTTEANLGDGIFPAERYAGGGHPGHFGIGSDSHVSVSVAEELRLLEYGQRLVTHRRAALATREQPSPGERLYTAAAAGGAQALGLEGGRLAPGCRADLVVLDTEHPALWNKTPAQALDAWIFAGDSRCVRDVMVGGAWRIQGGRHPRDEEFATRFRAAQAGLLA